MSLVTRLQAARNRAVIGGAALLAGMVAAPGAWAQCTDIFQRTCITPSRRSRLGHRRAARSAKALNPGVLLATINTINTAFLTQTTLLSARRAMRSPIAGRRRMGTNDRWNGGCRHDQHRSPGHFGLLPGTANTGTQKCNSTARQDYWAYQLGHDISILNGGASGVNWHFGVTAGYFTANTRDITGGATYTNPLFPGTTFNSPRGSFEADSDVPFVGLYTAVTKGGFFMDGQARWDFFQNSLSDVNNGLRGQELNAHGFSLTGNMGYNHALGRGWFLEPSGGLVWSRVFVDPLSVPGIPLGAGRLGAGTVTIDDVDSLLGRLSLRVGTNFTHGRYGLAAVLHG